MVKKVEKVENTGLQNKHPEKDSLQADGQIALSSVPPVSQLKPQVSHSRHPTFSLTCGRITVQATVLRAGEDLCVLLSGGDKPHIGCVTLSIARPSLADAARGSATTSVLNITGHKDGEAAQYLSQRLAAALQKTVVVSGGIHVKAIQPAEIHTVMEMVRALTDALIGHLSAG